MADVHEGDAPSPAAPGTPRGEPALRRRSVRGRPPCGRPSGPPTRSAASAAARTTVDGLPADGVAAQRRPL